MRGGIECIWRLGADSTRSGLTHRLILSLDPERRKNRLANHRVNHLVNCLVSVDAQAACDFRCSASKLPPFFQRANVMAAILRASVRRAISGFMPLASNLALKSCSGPAQRLAFRA